MRISLFRFRLLLPLVCALLAAQLLSTPARAQAQQTPLTSDELVRLVRQLPTHPSMRDDIVGEIRRRGIGFPLTSGLLSVVATKSGNDALLRRTLEEAERRRQNPVAAALPSEAEGRELLARARTETLAAAEAMPDFVVKEQIVRSFARGLTKNWNVSDRLTVAVSFRAKAGEQYRVLAVNGMPSATSADWSNNIEQVGGATSTGDYVSRLTMVFLEESKTDFKLVDTDTLRGRRTAVYEYEIKKDFSTGTLTFNNSAQTVVVGDRGRVWIDRENARVLRLESSSTEIPPGFPITAASRTIDYEWVTIAERQYLLPSRAVVELTARVGSQLVESRNDVRFRGYQKYGSEIRIIEEDIVDDEELKKEQPKSKP